MEIGGGRCHPASGGRALVGDVRQEEPLGEVLRSALSAPDQVLVAGDIDDVVLGVAAARVHRPTSAPGHPIGVVEMLYVEPQARRVGVGEAMMNVVIAWGEEVGCHGIDAPALPGSREAKAFFETVGLVTRVLVMHRRIDPTTRRPAPPLP